MKGRRALASFWSAGQAWARRHWRDVLFSVLAAAGLFLYLVRPERAEQWAGAGRWWAALFQYRGLEQSESRYQGEPVLRRPADFSQSDLAAVASFGGTFDYLGADTAATLGEDGAVHLWLITYWRCTPAPCAGRVQYSWGRSGPGIVLARHDLAQAAGPAEPFVADRLLLPEAALEGVVAVQVEVEGRPLAVASPILQTEGETRLYIWQK